MIIWIINGFSQDIGSWDIEAFKNKDDAYARFFEYVQDLEAEVDDPDVPYAISKEDTFWVEKVEVK